MGIHKNISDTSFSSTPIGTIIDCTWLYIVYQSFCYRKFQI